MPEEAVLTQKCRSPLNKGFLPGEYLSGTRERVANPQLSAPGGSHR